MKLLAFLLLLSSVVLGVNNVDCNSFHSMNQTFLCTQQKIGKEIRPKCNNEIALKYETNHETPEEISGAFDDSSQDSQA